MQLVSESTVPRTMRSSSITADGSTDRMDLAVKNAKMVRIWSNYRILLNEAADILQRMRNFRSSCHDTNTVDTQTLS